MRIFSRKTLRRYWERRDHADAEQPLRAWFHEVSKAEWRNPASVKDMYRSASIVGNNRVVFNIAGNKYCLVVKVNYTAQMVFIRLVGMHREYDKVDVSEV